MDDTALQPLPWLPILETGHAEIDRQHRELIDDANVVYDLVTRRGSWTNLLAAVDKMSRDCAVHFPDENKLLSGSGYPDAAAHELEHQRILGEIAQIHGIVRTTRTPRAIIGSWR